MFLIGTTLLSTEIVSGQSYPNKPLRVITSEAGGVNDVAARMIGQGISATLGQAVIIDNRGIVGFELVAKAASDGYTLLFQGTPFWIGPLLQKTRYDPAADFSPITLATRSPNVLVVQPSLPVNSIKELIALAKSKPGQLNYASGQVGASAHLGAELFKAMAGVDIVRIGYKGGGAATNALLGGEVQLLFVSPASVAAFVKSGRLKPLAVASLEPSALTPGLPTVSASGLPGYESASLAGYFAPAKTPEVVIRRLSQEIVRFLNRAEVKERLLGLGVEVVAGTPAELAATLKSEMSKYGKVIKDVGIRIE